MSKNYYLPVDAALFPEGVQRCSLTKFLLWLGLCGTLALFGLVAAFLVFKDGLGHTNLDDYFGFGLWIAFDLAVIALGAGAFFSGFLRYILNIEPLKNIVNLAVIIGFICYTGAMLVLLLDIGQPIRAWFGFWHPNVHSMLTEVIFCITCYCIVLIIEYVPIILEQKQINRNGLAANIAHNLHLFMPLFAGVGAFLSTFHQGSLGGMFGVMFARPFAFREGFFIWPWTFFLFILSAIASGPALTTLVCSFIEKLTGKKLVSWDVKQLMGRIAGVMLLVYLIFKIGDTIGWVTGMLPKEGLSFDQMFHGYIYGKWLMISELVICGIIPCIMLLIPQIRKTPALFYVALVLNCAGVAINRYIMTCQTLAFPSMPFDAWATYAPNWVEWAPCIMVIGYGGILLSLSYRYLPVFPQEKELNS